MDVAKTVKGIPGADVQPAVSFSSLLFLYIRSLILYMSELESLLSTAMLSISAMLVDVVNAWVEHTPVQSCQCEVTLK